MAKTNKSKAQEIDSRVKEFYDAVRELLFRAEQYAESFYLKESLLDEEEWYALIDKLDEYYAGDMERLNEEINQLHEKCVSTILRINSLCRKNGIMEIKEYDRLVRILVWSERRRFWEKAIEKKMRENKIVPLQEIEKEYQETF